jgi:cytochrome c oxidase subunit 1
VAAYLFGFSMYFFCLVMMGAGTLGVSRRHWDMAFSGAALAYEWPGAAYLMMGWWASGVIAAIVGGAIYIYITVGSLLWGASSKTARSAAASRRCPVPRPAPSRRATARWASPPRHVRAGDGVPGAFVLYYFINWKYLSTLWGLS